MDTPERTMESEANEPRPVDPPPEGANQDEALTSSEKRLLLGLAVAGAVILLVVVLVNFVGGGSSDDSSPSADSAPSGQPDPKAFTGDGAIAATPSQLAPAATPVVDDLDRDTLKGGPLSWSVVGEGDWQPDNGELVTDTEPVGASPMAVVEMPAKFGEDWRFSIVVEKPSDNAGLVFGVEDAENYWELTFNSTYAAAAVNHVRDGESKGVQVIGPTEFGRGVSWQVQHEGDTVTLASEGEPFFERSGSLPPPAPRQRSPHLRLLLSKARDEPRSGARSPGWWPRACRAQGGGHSLGEGLGALVARSSPARAATGQGGGRWVQVPLLPPSAGSNRHAVTVV